MKRLLLFLLLIPSLAQAQSGLNCSGGPLGCPQPAIATGVGTTATVQFGNIGIGSPNGATAPTELYSTTAPTVRIQQTTNSVPTQLRLVNDATNLVNFAYNGSAQAGTTAGIANANLAGIFMNDNAKNFMINTLTTGTQYFANGAIIGVAVGSGNLGDVYMPNLQTSAGGAQAGTVCLTTTKQLINESVATCLVSSERYKHDIEPMVHGWDWLSQLQPVTWQWNDPEMRQPTMGVATAEKAAAIDPSLASFGVDGKPLTLNDRGIMGVMVNTIKELEARIQQLEAK